MLDEDRKGEAEEGPAAVPVCTPPPHCGTCRSVLVAGGSRCQLLFTLPEPGSRRPHPLRLPAPGVPPPSSWAVVRQCPPQRAVTHVGPVQASQFWRPQLLAFVIPALEVPVASCSNCLCANSVTLLFPFCFSCPWTAVYSIP